MKKLKAQRPKANREIIYHDEIDLDVHVVGFIDPNGQTKSLVLDLEDIGVVIFNANMEISALVCHPADFVTDYLTKDMEVFLFENKAEGALWLLDKVS